MSESTPKKRILVVEDNALNQKLFHDLLETYGYAVFETKDGLEALDLVRTVNPDLILMDIQLHGVSGADIIREIKSIDKIKEIPIIAVTAFAMKDDEEKIMASGCDAYVSKPISIMPFLDIVSKFLNEDGPRRPIK